MRGRHHWMYSDECLPTLCCDYTIKTGTHIRGLKPLLESKDKALILVEMGDYRCVHEVETKKIRPGLEQR